MNGAKLYTLTPRESEDTISAKTELLASFQDEHYRREFVAERVRSSMALQIRALRDQRKMSQASLGEAIGMAQTWVSKLENPDYGKMTVATLLRLANAFDTDLEIKFRPFSTTIDTLPRQGKDYFFVPSFHDEFGREELSTEEQEKAQSRSTVSVCDIFGGSALAGIGNNQQGSMPLRIGPRPEEGLLQQHATR